MPRWPWTRDPRWRHIVLSMVTVGFFLAVDAWLVYGASQGHYDATTRSIIVLVNIIGICAAVYFALGEDAATGGADIASEVTGNDGEEESGNQE